MTFIEAAAEILARVGKPLHFKTLTDIAIQKNLLSHVGKSPEVTMSARLATLVGSDANNSEIIRVKPGVFGLRSFSPSVLQTEAKIEEALASEGLQSLEASHLRREPTPPEAPTDADSTDITDLEEAVALSEDDEPILGADSDDADEGADEEEGDAEGSGDGRSSRRRRRRRRGNGRGDNTAASAQPAVVTVPMNTPPADTAVFGRQLSDAIDHILENSQEREWLTPSRIAEILVQKGRLEGQPQALAPTVAAAMRSDIALTSHHNRRPRFRTSQGRYAHQRWWQTRDANRAESDALTALDRYREQTRRLFVRKLKDLPIAGFVELMASWLNAESIGTLRAVRLPTAGNVQPGSEIHLAGVLRRGYEETRVAIVIYRDGRDVGREQVIDARGAMHHYGKASMAWIVTLGSLKNATQEEANVPGLSPVVLFDQETLCDAMERKGIGLKAYQLEIPGVDLDLFDGLRGQVESPPRESRENNREPSQDDRQRSRNSRTRRPPPSIEPPTHSTLPEAGASEAESTSDVANTADTDVARADVDGSQSPTEEAHPNSANDTI